MATSVGATQLAALTPSALRAALNTCPNQTSCVRTDKLRTSGTALAHRGEGHRSPVTVRQGAARHSTNPLSSLTRAARETQPNSTPTPTGTLTSRELTKTRMEWV